MTVQYESDKINTAKGWMRKEEAVVGDDEDDDDDGGGGARGGARSCSGGHNRHRDAAEIQGKIQSRKQDGTILCSDRGMG
ncbi:unnamed protein product [Schistocephalus solidus]|uniref:Uncharacterized protein n=1 Tax=Schistocephalus solidus TaxID=70667 RepID=A0A183SJX8_SCHSO|nr:unnamed protein product [Schistocephalus solidus]